MGGIIIAITLIIASCIMYTNNKEILPLSLLIIGFGVVGFVDDFKKLVLKDTEGLKPAYKMLRFTCYFSYICTIFNQKWNRDKYFYSWNKSDDKFASNSLFTICNFCDAWNNKCSKSNRWNRWLSHQHFNDNYCGSFSDCN